MSWISGSMSLPSRDYTALVNPDLDDEAVDDDETEDAADETKFERMRVVMNMAAELPSAQRGRYQP